MPPNLGGFFMVRSYYPSECHADYFDFERIEALKPAIEACGISHLSQSQMLGFHQQIDNRIKFLEEILSFRMQGVEFDNGDMYVDGHKAASDVRDEFVSVPVFLQAEEGIRYIGVTGVQTCALPIYVRAEGSPEDAGEAVEFARERTRLLHPHLPEILRLVRLDLPALAEQRRAVNDGPLIGDGGIGRASCRERGEISVVAVALKKKKE